MRILKSDFPGLAELLIHHLGLSNRSLYERGDYFYFQFYDLLKRDKFDWKELDIDTRDALSNMGMVFSDDGRAIGEKIELWTLAKNIKTDHLREHAKLRSEFWKEAARKSQLAKKREEPYKLKLFITSGEAICKPKQKSITAKPLILSSGKPQFLQIPEKFPKKSIHSTKPLLKNSIPGLTIKTLDLNTNPPAGVLMPITPPASSTPPRRVG